jgi:KaiC/GvpD/RAD55 family RecA-like ATPase
MSVNTGMLDFFREGVIIVRGLPGAGKTLLAAKAVSEFGNVAWFTFYETEERLAKYLASVSLKPPAHVFDLVAVRDKSLVQFIVEKVLEVRPDAVVVDGLNALTAEGERELVHAIFYHGISRGRPVVLIKEGVETTPADYIADIIIEVEHRVLEGGVSTRDVKVLKARGKAVRYTSLPYVITEEGPVVITPIGARPPPVRRLPTGLSEVDSALGGGWLEGSFVAVVGPPDGLASKLMAVSVGWLAMQGYKILYSHHKPAASFVKAAESLGLDVSRVNWHSSPPSEAKSFSWWYEIFSLAARGGYDGVVFDQIELLDGEVAPLLEGAAMLCGAKGCPLAAFIFNSYRVWREVADRIAPLMDYILILKRRRIILHTPDRLQPHVFNWGLDETGRPKIL